MVIIDDQEASSSKGPLPPAFADSKLENEPQHTVIDMDGGSSTKEGLPVPEGPPPEFTPYEAEYTVGASGCVSSHDPHLNDDGEALYRFLLAQSSKPPVLQCHIGGSHTETYWVEQVTTDSNGTRTVQRRQETRVVTDFAFSIDLTQHLRNPPKLWTAADKEPEYRGQMYREVEEGGVVRRPLPAEESAAKDWRHLRIRRGLPPWTAPGEDRNQSQTLRSSRTVRQWADMYSASSKILKEFEYTKVVYGWDFEALEEAIRAAIRQSSYQGTITVNFPLSAEHVHVRPDTQFSRISKTWCKVLLWLFLIYPFIMLFRHLHPRGGGRWTVSGAAWPLKWTGGGGIPEGRWFREWEGTICQAASERLQSGAVLTTPRPSAFGRFEAPGAMLDGYN